MKVTCGACSKVLRVEDWLADNVARCPKCDEVIRVPPKGSPDGAIAVVLTTAEATDLLRRRADAGLVPSILPGEMSRSAAPAAPGQSGGRPTNPKTEPLPAFLRHASASIHEEPEHRKTRPLPRPAGMPAAGKGTAMPPAAQPPAPQQVIASSRPAAKYGAEAETAAQEEQAAADAAEESPRKFGLISPLVPIAFVAGLMIGALCGWLIGRATSGPRSDHDATPTPAAVRAGDSPQASPPPDNHRLIAPTPTPTPAAELPINPPTPPLPIFPRDKWLAEQPKGVRAEVVKVDNPAVLVAGLTESWPPNFLYYPAPQGMAYVQVRASLKWTGLEPITFALGGDKPGCWLLTHDGQVYDPLGQPKKATAPGKGDSPADPAAKVTLDKSNPAAEVNVLFLTPMPLPGQPVRLMFTGSQYADLPGEIREPSPVVPGRSIAGRWEPVPNQTLPGQFNDAQKYLAAVANADRSHTLQINQVGSGNGFEITIEKANIRGTLKPRKGEPAYFDASLTMDGEKATPAARFFEAGKLMLIYFTNDKFGQFAYRRYEEKMPGE